MVNAAPVLRSERLLDGAVQLLDQLRRHERRLQRDAVRESRLQVALRRGDAKLRDCRVLDHPILPVGPRSIVHLVSSWAHDEEGFDSKGSALRRSPHHIVLLTWDAVRCRHIGFYLCRPCIINITTLPPIYSTSTWSHPHLDTLYITSLQASSNRSTAVSIRYPWLSSGHGFYQHHTCRS
jgi:hypothetical protein